MKRINIELNVKEIEYNIAGKTYAVQVTAEKVAELERFVRMEKEIIAALQGADGYEESTEIIRAMVDNSLGVVFSSEQVDEIVEAVGLVTTLSDVTTQVVETYVKEFHSTEKKEKTNLEQLFKTK